MYVMIRLCDYVGSSIIDLHVASQSGERLYSLDNGTT
jgi:hypothetical protein